MPWVGVKKNQILCVILAAITSPIMTEALASRVAKRENRPRKVRALGIERDRCLGMVAPSGWLRDMKKALGFLGGYGEYECKIDQETVLFHARYSQL